VTQYKQAVIIGITLGVTAAVIVWFLERFERGQLHTEVRDYLKQWDAFDAWRKERGHE
jgi:hypothetical protein